MDVQIIKKKKKLIKWTYSAEAHNDMSDLWQREGEIDQWQEIVRESQIHNVPNKISRPSSLETSSVSVVCLTNSEMKSTIVINACINMQVAHK